MGVRKGVFVFPAVVYEKCVFVTRAQVDHLVLRIAIFLKEFPYEMVDNSVLIEDGNRVGEQYSGHPT